MNRNSLSVLALVVALGVAMLCPTPRAAAQDIQPIATISIAGYDALWSDIEFFAKLSGNEAAIPNMKMMVEMTTGGLAGVDKTRPAGVLLLPDPMSPVQVKPLGFVPVTDLNQVLGLVGKMGMLTQPAADGVTQIQPNPMAKPVFVKQQGQWAFIAMAQEHLASLPADPTALLSKAAKGCDVALALHVAKIPDGTRNTLTMFLDMGAEMGLQPKPGESNEAFQLRAKSTRQSIQQFKTALNELDTLLVGLNVNPTDKADTMSIDVQVTAKPGTKMADTMARVKKATSAFAGFAAPGAAVTVNVVGTMSPDDMAQTKAMLDIYEATLVQKMEDDQLPEAEMAKAKKLLGELFGVLKDTVDEGVSDLGAAVLVSPDAATLVGGLRIADGPKLDKTLRDLVKAASEEIPDVAGMVKLDAGSHGDITFHSVSIPLPPLDPGDGARDVKSREAAVRLVGESLEVVVGTGPKAVYLAAGRDAMTKLTEAIDRSKSEAGTEILPSHAVIDLKPIIDTASAFVDDPKGQQMMATAKDVLDRAGSDTHITMTATPIPGGMQQRLEFEKGSLEVMAQMVGEAARAAQEAAMRMQQMRAMPQEF
ncbi:MAG: hypothetical protein JW818_01360 [Pirellulales bacterium]|nr:hypothetical protein [Pirellulales bacterium]